MGNDKALNSCNGNTLLIGGHTPTERCTSKDAGGYCELSNNCDTLCRDMAYCPADGSSRADDARED